MFSVLVKRRSGSFAYRAHVIASIYRFEGPGIQFANASLGHRRALPVGRHETSRSDKNGAREPVRLQSFVFASPGFHRLFTAEEQRAARSLYDFAATVFTEYRARVRRRLLRFAKVPCFRMLCES
jgi:hypothetical protein